MVDLVLLGGKLVMLALLYLFLLAVVRAGLGMVAAGAPVKGARTLALRVVAGPPGIAGVKVPLSRAVSIGRSPGSDLVIADDFVSARHALVTPGPSGLRLEDLGSTNGTVLNGRPISRPVQLREGDVITLGDVRLKVEPL